VQFDRGLRPRSLVLIVACANVSLSYYAPYCFDLTGRPQNSAYILWTQYTGQCLRTESSCSCCYLLYVNVISDVYGKVAIDGPLKQIDP
jgi:hypothetical protein